MDTRRLSAAFGFTLLIVCVAGVAYLIHNGGSSRLLPPSTIPPSTRDASVGIDRNKKRGKEGFANDPNYQSSQPTMQEVNELADELQRLLHSKGPPGGKKITAVNGVAKTPQQRTSPPLRNATGEDRPSATPAVSSVKNKASISAINYSTVPKNAPGRVSHSPGHHPPNLGQGVPGPPGSVEVHNPPPPEIEVEHGPGLHHDLYKIPWHAAIPDKMKEQVETYRHPLDYNHTPDKPILHHQYYQNRPPFPPARPVGGRRPGQGTNLESEDGSSLMEMLADAAKRVVSTQDDDDDEEEEEEEEDEEDPDEEEDYRNPLEGKQITAQLDTLYQLASNLFTSANHSTLQGFLKVVNETIQRSNSSRLLQQLNEVYVKTGSTSRNESGAIPLNNRTTTTALFAANGTQSLLDIKNLSKPYETSLTAFVFMTFGVFLLNQIHSFVQNSGTRSHHHPRRADEDLAGRSLLNGNLAPWLLEPSSDTVPGELLLLKKEPSSLDILFEPSGSSEKSPASSKNGTSWKSEGRSYHEPAEFGEKHVNNLFRGLLNIGNAYAKDRTAVKCIWSLYCRDLDSTSKKEGLYGVAARINSVGLRLIMNQIPPSMTLDVMLRSLVGWDGLPCHKMFPECAVGNGTMSLITPDKSSALKEGKRSRLL